MSDDIPNDAPRPRMCHLRRWSDFNGYGFNLHAEKGKVGHFVGKVDLDSPSDYAGLKEGDRIVEVNGTNIGNENHQQVVTRIKAVPNEVKLLVADSETEEYFKDRRIVIRGDLDNVWFREVPAQRPSGDSPTVPRAERPNGTGNSIDKPVNCQTHSLSCLAHILFYANPLWSQVSNEPWVRRQWSVSSCYRCPVYLSGHRIRAGQAQPTRSTDAGPPLRPVLQLFRKSQGKPLSWGPCWWHPAISCL